MDKKLLPLILVAFVVAVLSAAVTSALLAPSAQRVDAAPPGDADPGALARTVERLDARQEELARALEELRLRPAPSARVSTADIEAAVARVLADDGEAAAVRAPARGAVEASQAAALEPERAVADAFARLIDPSSSQEERQEIWARLGAQGLSDELVAEFEARAEREPNDPDVRVDLGAAYLQKVFESGNGPMAGVWAMKADGAFDKALELDGTHWDARFHKAVSLSFWPPALGKQNQAIAQFEILVEQQKSQPKSPQFAQTYLFLGNMYQQTGKGDQALEAWQQGLALYPDDAELAKQVALALGK